MRRSTALLELRGDVDETQTEASIILTIQTLVNYYEFQIIFALQNVISGYFSLHGTRSPCCIAR